MLFNSYSFILVFLPITLLIVLSLRHFQLVSASLSALCVASLIFYAVWDWRFLGLLLGSICFNYLVISYLVVKPTRVLMWIGVTVNVAGLAFFKYATFVSSNFAALTGSAIAVPDIVLPLAVSFFTLQQISIVIDMGTTQQTKPQFRDYALFVSFFPQLIAGPIVRHNELLPQIRNLPARINSAAIATGTTLFVIGLVKKIVLADSLRPYADVVFANAEQENASLGFIESWLGAFAYHFQIYFDFSGYSDMAIGLALLFGLRLPLNFASPYKATSIIDFWRRWHLTLSRFLRDYLYIPLGGNRGGLSRQNLRIMLVMLVGGLWHGSEWTFVIWGGVHGLMIAINHAWRRMPLGPVLPPQAAKLIYGSVTTVGIVVAWVFFRAESFSGAGAMLTGMLGLGGLGTIEIGRLSLTAFAEAIALGSPGKLMLDANVLPILAVSFVLVWFCPSSQQLVAYGPDQQSDNRILFGHPFKAAALAGIAFSISLLALAKPSEFLYFQF